MSVARQAEEKKEGQGEKGRGLKPCVAQGKSLANSKSQGPFGVQCPLDPNGTGSISLPTQNVGLLQGTGWGDIMC